MPILLLILLIIISTGLVIILPLARLRRSSTERNHIQPRDIECLEDMLNEIKAVAYRLIEQMREERKSLQILIKEADQRIRELNFLLRKRTKQGS